MKKQIMSLLLIVGSIFIFTGCGEKVIIKNDEVAKQLSSNGLDPEIIQPGAHKLDACFPGQACPKLVKLRVGEESTLVEGKYHIKDNKMDLELNLFIQYGIKKEKDYLDTVFDKVKSDNEEGSSVELVISTERVYNRFLRPEIRDVVRTALNNYDIETIMENLTVVREFVENEVKKHYKNSPIKIITVSFDKVAFPKAIVESNIQNNKIELDKAIKLKGIKAELEIEKARFNLKKERAKMDLAVDNIIADKMNPNLAIWKLLNGIEVSAENGTPWAVNVDKVFQVLKNNTTDTTK